MQRELNHDERYSNLLEKWEAEKREIVKVKRELMEVRGEKEIVEQKLENMNRKFHLCRELIREGNLTELWELCGEYEKKMQTSDGAR